MSEGLSTEKDYLRDAVEAVLLADSRRTEPIPLALADALDQLRRCRYGSRQPVPADVSVPPAWDEGTDWEAEKRAASGVDDPWDEGDETPLPSDLGAC